MHAHRLFGINLASDLPFAIHLGDGGAVPDLTFSLSAHAPAPPLWRQSRPVYASPWRTEDGESASLLYRGDSCEILCFPGPLDFYLWPDRIVCHLRDPAFRPMVEIYLLGPVLAYWLERRGIPVLHASAVSVACGAAAFVAAEGTGKSGLAAALLGRGAALLGDDLVPVEECDGTFSARSGFPQMRMWPDAASHFLRRYEHLPQVSPDTAKRWVPAGPEGFGVFQSSPSPLACVYLLDRPQQEGGTGIEIRALSPRDALIELLRHSFASLLVDAAGLQPARFDLLSRLVTKVPVRRLSYPSGFSLLPRVADAVLRDLGC
jgi:hypothetical protein